jgi:hypothetical protein
MEWRDLPYIPVNVLKQGSLLLIEQTPQVPLVAAEMTLAQLATLNHSFARLILSKKRRFNDYLINILITQYMN